MRINIFILLLFLGWQTVYGQLTSDTPVSLQLVNQDIPNILRQLSEQTNIKITFSSSFFDKKKKYSLSIDQQPIGEVLNQLLAPTNVDFKISNNRILLFRRQINYHSISGYIEEKGSGERLIAATVFCPSLNKGTVTNEYGFYSLSLPAGEYEIVISYLGYEQKEWQFSLNQNLSHRIELSSNNFLTEIIVHPDSIENPYFVSQNKDYFELSPQLIKLTPSLGGSNDPIRTAQLLPGVQSGGDGLGGIQVRGSDNGHNQMLLDGVPVYIPYHLLGVFSVYNASAVKSAKLLNGKFSARYGGSLSSVFDVRIREGNRYKWKAEGGINLTNGQLLIEGPLKKGKSSILFAARMDHSNFLFEPMLNRTVFFNPDNKLNSNYLDINAKINYQLSKKDRIYFSLYEGGDFMYSENVEIENTAEETTQLSLSWGNTISSFRWNHLFSDKIFGNISLNYSKHEFDYGFLNEVFIEEQDLIQNLFFYNIYSRNTDKGIRLDLDYLPSPKHTFRFGAGFLDRTFAPEITFFDENSIDIIDADIDNINDFAPFLDIKEELVKELYVYVEDQILLKNNWQLNLGLRASSFLTKISEFNNFEPRVTIKHQPIPDLEWSFSANRMVQYLHLISSSSLRLPTDLWLPSSETVRPQSAWLTEMDMKYKAGENINISFSAYYKFLNKLYILPDFISTIDLGTEELDELLIEGSGTTTGVELLLDYHDDKKGFITSYVLSKSTRDFPTHSQQEAYPFEYDTRHQFKIFYYQQLANRLHFSVNWIYNSPSPRRYLQPSELGNTLVTVDVNEEGEKNKNRSITYHRLDIDFNYEINKTKSTHLFKLGVYNIYNRKNVAFYELVESNHNSFSKPVSSFPFLPSFSYQIKF